jgi:flagella basal body P-ring formation protein FlgA
MWTDRGNIVRRLSSTQPQTRAGLVKILTAALLWLSAVPVQSADLQSPDVIRAQVRDFVTRSVARPDARLEVEVGPLDPRLRVSRCPGNLTAFRPPGARPVGRSHVGLRCEASPGWTIYIPVQVRLYAPVLVAKHPLVRGSTLANSDIRHEIMDLGSLPPGVLSNPADVAGRQMLYPVAGGTVLRVSLIKANRLIQRGEKITILARTGGIEVRVAGEALHDGFAGEPVQVRNLLTQKIIHAIPREAGVVQINL